MYIKIQIKDEYRSRISSIISNISDYDENYELVIAEIQMLYRPIMIECSGICSLESLCDYVKKYSNYIRIIDSEEIKSLDLSELISCLKFENDKTLQPSEPFFKEDSENHNSGQFTYSDNAMYTDSDGFIWINKYQYRK